MPPTSIAFQAQDPTPTTRNNVASTDIETDAPPLPKRIQQISQSVQRAEFDPPGAAQTSIAQVVISLSHASDRRYLDLPAKAGDVIIVPAAGQVTVQGWVDKPGAFPITNGMTALGAIASAGGALFTSSATLLREQKNGIKLSIPLDLFKDQTRPGARSGG